MTGGCGASRPQPDPVDMALMSGRVLPPWFDRKPLIALHFRTFPGAICVHSWIPCQAAHEQIFQDGFRQADI